MRYSVDDEETGSRLHAAYAALNTSATNIPSICRTAIIVRNDAMILPHNANPMPDGIFGKDSSPFGQLELDAAVAPVGILGPAEINRLKFAKPGGNKVLWRYTLANEILHHRDCARGR